MGSAEWKLPPRNTVCVLPALSSTSSLAFPPFESAFNELKDCTGAPLYSSMASPGRRALGHQIQPKLSTNAPRRPIAIARMHHFAIRRATPASNASSFCLTPVFTAITRNHTINSVPFYQGVCRCDTRGGDIDPFFQCLGADGCP